MRRLFICLAWASIGLIAYATLTRIGFVYAIYFKLAPILLQPEMKTYARYEHVIAFAVFGALFCFAYPQYTGLVCCVVFGSAALLEYLQTLTPDRHGTLVDVVEKIIGGAGGIALAKLTLALAQKRRERMP
jgi:hypothetical protein